MKLYIQVENGQAIGHPMLENNILGLYDGVIPSDWQPFERCEIPTLGVYEVLDSYTPTYKNIDGIWKDSWDVREMTSIEKVTKQQDVRYSWNYNKYSSWVFNEITCEFEPPVSKPNDGKFYIWDDINVIWVQTPDYPSDGLKYIFDSSIMQWVNI